MTFRLLTGAGLCLSLFATTAWANDALRGTWSGHWAPGGEGRDAVTVEFELRDDMLVGHMVNPEPLDFAEVSFDAASGRLVAEASAEDSSVYRIEATLSDTRLEGTLTHSDSQGELRLTKWTYRPRIR
jgi:hypothetical protein